MGAAANLDTMRAQARCRALTTSTLLLLALSACTSGSSSDAPEASDSPTVSRTPVATSSPVASSSYVALGDSFTAGPGIGAQQADAGLCQRSTLNWPTLLAATLHLDATDVSCSGATTGDLANTEASGVVGADTRLVTLSAGGNDGGLFLSLIRACTGGTDACGTFVDQQAPPILQRTTSDLVDLLKRVRSDAPGAAIVLVGYPQIMPATGTCGAVGIAADDAASVLSAEHALDDALAAAARGAGVTYVSPLGPAVGHDACAGDDAWTNGRSPVAGDGISFHPNRRGMAAIADLVAAAVPD